MEAVMETMSKINIEDITPSKTNPRKRFDKAELAGLAESIKQKGVLEPVLVRPLESNGKTTYEIVAGERRFRGSKIAGLTEIPTIIKKLSDSEAKEIQIIENLQRADLHPLEEADGFQKLMDSEGLSIEDVSAKVGKSKTYIYQRLKFLALSGNVKKLFLKQEISASVALLFARIPHKELQNKALEELLDDGDELTYKNVFDFIERNCMTRLKDAPFNTKDSDLLPKAGACLGCPKRTGNEKELFPDIEREDTCTDPICFKQKKEAAWLRRAKKATEKGWTVIEGKEADKICPYGYVSDSSNYVDLNASQYRNGKSITWRKMVKKHIPPITLVRNSNEKVYELVTKTELEVALKMAGYKLKEKEKNFERTSTTGVSRKTIRIKQEACVLATKTLVGKIEKFSYQDLVKLVVPLVIRNRGMNALWDIAKRRGLVESRKDDYQKALNKEVLKLGEDELKGLLLELSVSGDKWSTYCGFSENFKEACKSVGVDLKLAEKEAEIAIKSKKNGRKSGGKK